MLDYIFSVIVWYDQLFSHEGNIVKVVFNYRGLICTFELYESWAFAPCIHDFQDVAKVAKNAVEHVYFEVRVF